MMASEDPLNTIIEVLNYKRPILEISRLIDNKCSICHKTFLHQTDLVKHAKQFHPKVKLFKCSNCDVHFSNVASIKSHSCRISKGSICGFCSVSFNCIEDLERHFATHSPIRPYTCSMCKETFVLKAHLYKHRKEIHSSPKEKNYICEFCCNTYDSFSKWKTHITVHTGEHPYCCDVCDKTFKRKLTLSLHRKTHFNKNYVCEFCLKSFIRPNRLIEHKRVHIGQCPLNISSEDGKYKATPIEKLDSKNRNVDTIDLIEEEPLLEDVSLDVRHIKENKNYVCEFCWESFSQLIHLFEHKKVHTGERPYSYLFGKNVKDHQQRTIIKKYFDKNLDASNVNRKHETSTIDKLDSKHQNVDTVDFNKEESFSENVSLDVLHAKENGVYVDPLELENCEEVPKTELRKNVTKQKLDLENGVLVYTNYNENDEKLSIKQIINDVKDHLDSDEEYIIEIFE